VVSEQAPATATFTTALSLPEAVVVLGLWSRWSQLISKTNLSGEVNTTVAGIYGPYLENIAVVSPVSNPDSRPQQKHLKGKPNSYYHAT
jgi:hypothetical protein